MSNRVTTLTTGDTVELLGGRHDGQIATVIEAGDRIVVVDLDDDGDLIVDADEPAPRKKGLVCHAGEVRPAALAADPAEFRIDLDPVQIADLLAAIIANDGKTIGIDPRAWTCLDEASETSVKLALSALPAGIVDILERAFLREFDPVDGVDYSDGSVFGLAKVTFAAALLGFRVDQGDLDQLVTRMRRARFSPFNPFRFVFFRTNDTVTRDFTQLRRVRLSTDAWPDDETRTETLGSGCKLTWVADPASGVGELVTEMPKVIFSTNEAGELAEAA